MFYYGLPLIVAMSYLVTPSIAAAAPNNPQLYLVQEHDPAPDSETVCSPLDKKLAWLKDKYKEVIVFRGQSDVMTDGEIIVTESPDKTSWSLLLAGPKDGGKIACMINSGSSVTDNNTVTSPNINPNLSVPDDTVPVPNIRPHPVPSIPDQSGISPDVTNPANKAAPPNDPPVDPSPPTDKSDPNLHV